MIKSLFQLSSIGLLFVMANAQTPQSLSVEQAVSFGLEKSKSMHVSLMKVHFADAKSSETNIMKLPTVKFSGAYTYLSEIPSFEIGPFPPMITDKVMVSPFISNNYSMRFTLQQPVFTGFRISKSAAAAEYTAEASAGDYRNDRLALIYSIKNAYWGLFRAQELMRVVDENFAQTELHLKDISNFFDEGMVTKNEVLKVEVQLSNVRLLQIETQNSVRLSMISLNSLIGIPLETQLALNSSLESDDKNYGELKELLDLAMENRPDLNAMRLRFKAGEAGVSAARSGWFPQIFLQANYVYARPNQRIFPVQDRFKETWDISMTASFDIWNWGATLHQVDQAEAQLSQIEDGLAQLNDALVLEVTQAYLYINQAKEKIGVAEKSVAQAEENYRITNQKFQSGLVLNSELLDAEVALLQTKFNYIQALVEYKQADAKLQKSVGIEQWKN